MTIQTHAQGFTLTEGLSATPEGEEHGYRKGDERVRFKIAKLQQKAATLDAGQIMAMISGPQGSLA